MQWYDTKFTPNIPVGIGINLYLLLILGLGDKVIVEHNKIEVVLLFIRAMLAGYWVGISFRLEFEQETFDASWKALCWMWGLSSPKVSL